MEAPRVSQEDDGLEGEGNRARIAARRREPPHIVRDSEDAVEAKPDAPGGRGRRSWLFAGAAAVALIAGGCGLAEYLLVGRFVYSTDDAYVRANLAIISPKISGYVADVGVIDNQHVKAGQILVRLDAGDYRLSVDAARGKIATQDATIARIAAQTEAQAAFVDQASAQLDGASAEQSRAASELTRVRSLAAADFATRQRVDQAVADQAKASAAMAGATAALAGARANLAVLQSQTREATSLRAELATAMARAERDLGFAEIRAPFDGAVGNRVVEPGQFAQPGARLMALAPDDGLYVEANFKETQLDRLAEGQRARIRVDALCGRTLDGEVQSIAPASGANYSLLPPENATGNFTKIIQRFPVRIRLTEAAKGLLRAGMSVVVEVDTRSDEAAKSDNKSEK
jgi:membrane fusion protein (multidrug efflux system)